MNIERPRHRLPHPYYLGLRNYFLTMCVADRRKLFTTARLVEVLVSTLLDQFCRAQLSIVAYCFMPDHCHILAGSLSQTCDLSRAVRSFKGVSATHAREMGVRKLWQRDYYDHILRSDESVNYVAAYIFANPVRAGLVKNPRDWPFSGSSAFEWKTLPPPIHDFVPSWKKFV